MKIGIVGHLGVVGSAVAHGFTRLGHEVIGHDIQESGSTLEPLLDATLIFVCVPTPQNADGSCDTSRVVEVVGWLAAQGYAGCVVIKSTVPPGTTATLAIHYKRLKLAFCPEFLRERAAAVDFVENHDLLVIGIDTTSGSRHASYADWIVKAHGHYPKAVAILTPTEAELCKYFSNVYNALRVVFANEFFEVCKAMNADYQAIKTAMVKRSTIDDHYLDCNDRYRGFGGMCLPKDTAAFAELARRVAPNMKLFEVIVDENKKFVTTVPDGMRP